MKALLRKAGFALGAFLILTAAALGTLKLIWTFGDRPPEFTTSRREVPEVHTGTAMVVAANPLATAAGVEMLQAGGSSIDAAVAIQAVLTLVEPDSSGIGGGAFILHFDHETKRLQAFDGRETAPAGSTPRLFMHGDGNPYTVFESMIGGRSVGVPGALRVLELAHRQHGKLQWRVLFDPAIKLCEEGFEITPRFSRLAHKDPLLRGMPGARRYFYDEHGRARRVGTRLKNPELAQVLRQVAEGGADAFYRGVIARDIVTAVRQAHRPSMIEARLNVAMLKMGAPYDAGFEAKIPNPGFMTEQDLSSYQAKEREPVCRPYKTWRVCGFGPPSSGGIAVLQTLAMLERFQLGKQYSANSPQALHLIAEAERLAYADRDRYVADADFVSVPLPGLLDSKYLAARSSLIDPAQAMKSAQPGLPPGIEDDRADSVSPELPSTSHISIVDADRNVLSMTTSIEYTFGSHVMVRGFMLNNQLTDFSFDPGPQNSPVANAPAPGKRPRSSMAPMIVFDAASGEPVLAIGSPGGSRIICYVVRALLGVLEWNLDPQRAVSLPHLVNRNSVTELEDEGWDAGELEVSKQKLAALGHEVELLEQNSGLHAISITEKGLLGGVDPRREGLAAGW
ncbi:MAG: gamma-glutamyltransferase family protein [Panacagrimonas sp.]